MGLVHGADRKILPPTFGLICYNARINGKELNNMIAERSEFKGKPTIVLKRSEDEKYPFSFGMAKAKMILDHLEDIKKFVAENDKTAGE